MFDIFLKEFGASLNKSWVANLFVPASCFWIASIWAFCTVPSITASVDWWTHLDIYSQVGLSLAAISAVVMTAVLLELFESMLIRMYAGYWHSGPFKWLRNILVNRQRLAFKKEEEQFNLIAAKIATEQATEEQLIEYERISGFLSDKPSRYRDIMPTQLGNILKSTENYTWIRYGLDATTIWPRLYFQLSDALKTALGFSYARMNTLLRLTTLSLFFGVIWIPYLLWNHAYLPATISGTSFLLGLICYQGAIQAAKQYNIAVQSAFDIHRFDLYSALKWPKPSKLSEESAPSDRKVTVLQGQKLSLFLDRGQWVEDVKYEFIKKKDANN